MAASEFFKAGIVHGEALHQILSQPFGGPDTKSRGNLRANPIAQ